MNFDKLLKRAIDRTEPEQDFYDNSSRREQSFTFTIRKQKYQVRGSWRVAFINGLATIQPFEFKIWTYEGYGTWHGHTLDQFCQDHGEECRPILEELADSIKVDTCFQPHHLEAVKSDYEQAWTQYIGEMQLR